VVRTLKPWVLNRRRQKRLWQYLAVKEMSSAALRSMLSGVQRASGTGSFVQNVGSPSQRMEDATKCAAGVATRSVGIQRNQLSPVELYIGTKKVSMLGAILAMVARESQQPSWQQPEQVSVCVPFQS